VGGKERPRGPLRSGAPVRLQHSVRPACGLRLSAAGLAGSAAHPPLRGRPRKRRRIRAVRRRVEYHRKSIAAQRPNRNGTLAQNDASRTSCARACGPAGVRPGVCKSTCGSAQKRRTLKERVSSGNECDLRKSRSFSTLPIVTRRDKTTGLVRAAHRAGRPEGSAKRADSSRHAPLRSPQLIATNH
jgi:hypothetical protein